MADIYNLISRKIKKQRQLREYESRLKNLNKLEKNIDDAIDGIVRVANEAFDTLNSGIASGINGINLSDNVIKDSFYEKSFGLDEHLRNVDPELKAEIRRCIRKIQDLEDDIDRLEDRIDEAREEDSEQ